METGFRADSPFDWDRALRHLQVLATIWFPRRQKGQFDPEDLAQETICKAIEKIEQFRGSTTVEFMAWLKQILRRVILDKMKDPENKVLLAEIIRTSQAKLEELVRSFSTSILSRIIRKELLRRVFDEMHALPPNQLRALALQVFHELSYIEVAGELECTTASVVGLLRRARANLREKLGDLLQP